VTVQQLINVLQDRGWRVARTENETRQLQHESENLTVTLSGKPELLVPPGVLRTIQRLARLEEDGDALRGGV
jgi:predicted RNA binding protein YcfA (HicA-like mRNA interferase family)